MVVTTAGKVLLQPIDGHQSDSIISVQSLNDIVSWNQYATFRIDKRYIPIWGLKLLQLLTLLPLGIAAFQSWRNIAVSGPALSWEFRKFLVIFGAMLVGYGSILFLSSFGYLQRVQRELLKVIAMGPDVLLLFILLIIIAVGYLGLRYILRIGNGVYPNAGLVFYLTTVFVIAGIQILNKTSLTQYMLLFPMIIFWPLISPTKYFAKQLTNLSLIGFSFIYYLAFIGYSVHQMSIRQVTSALFSSYFHPAVILFVCALFTTHIRMFSIAVHQPETQQSQLKFNAFSQSKRF